MNTVLWIADTFRQILVPFLIGAAVIFVLLLIGLVVQRVVRQALDRRRDILHARFEPLVDRCIGGADAGDDRARLVRFGRRSPALLGQMIVAPLLSLSGAPIARGAALAADAGVLEKWRAYMADRRWWRRAEAARSLGVIRDTESFAAFVAALDDDHEEVRAGAVDALGRLGDLRAVPELLSRLPAQSRHQRVRIIDAVRVLGPDGGPTLMRVVDANPETLVFVADLVPAICGVSAAAQVLTLCDHDNTHVRAAALNVLGTIGLDDNSFYYALKALGDPEPEVRGMAARALGRSGRDDSAQYLADHLMEENWTVAAESAKALFNLGAPGRATLAATASGHGQAASLAKQMLWEQQARSEARPS